MLHPLLTRRMTKSTFRRTASFRNRILGFLSSGNGSK
jgi:hypothetical protein